MWREGLGSGTGGSVAALGVAVPFALLTEQNDSDRQAELQQAKNSHGHQGQIGHGTVGYLSENPRQDDRDLDDSYHRAPCQRIKDAQTVAGDEDGEDSDEDDVSEQVQHSTTPSIIQNASSIRRMTYR